MMELLRYHMRTGTKDPWSTSLLSILYIYIYHHLQSTLLLPDNCPQLIQLCKWLNFNTHVDISYVMVYSASTIHNWAWNNPHDIHKCGYQVISNTIVGPHLLHSRLNVEWYCNRGQQHPVVWRPTQPLTSRLLEPSCTRRRQNILGIPALARKVK
jgi:hypothetical protein